MLSACEGIVDDSGRPFDSSFFIWGSIFFRGLLLKSKTKEVIKKDDQQSLHIPVTQPLPPQMKCVAGDPTTSAGHPGPMRSGSLRWFGGGPGRWWLWRHLQAEAQLWWWCVSFQWPCLSCLHPLQRLHRNIKSFGKLETSEQWFIIAASFMSSGLVQLKTCMNNPYKRYCVFVCICKCKLFICMYIYTYIYIDTYIYIYIERFFCTHTHTHIYIYIYLYI